LARLSILALAIGTLPVSAKVPQSPLVGTWVLTIQPPAPVPSYIEISTFAVDGTTTGSPSVQPPPGVISTGDVYGVWKGSGDEAGTYDSSVIALTYDKSGAVNGTVKFNNHFKLISESEIEGISQFQICDLNAVCPEPTPNSATFTGARLQIQPVTQ
jgi:hypothetical protein